MTVHFFLELNIGTTDRLATVWNALKAFVWVIALKKAK